MNDKKITRRESLRMLGLTGVATVAPSLILPSTANAADTCLLTSEITGGPYYVDNERIRSRIDESKPGVPLLLRITVLDSQRCKPLTNAAVDIWHCDARGYYSGYLAVDPDVNNNGPPMYNGKMGVWPPPTDENTFLRGMQITNARGVVEFTTIYPGWYFGRPIHIHVKVHTQGVVNGDQLAGGHVCHTGQFCFPDEITDRVAAIDNYAGRKLVRTRNNEDWIFDEHSAAESMVKLRPRHRDLKSGFIGEVVVAVNPEATPPPSRPRMNAPGRA